jgi:signal transduction histidine kinase
LIAAHNPQSILKQVSVVERALVKELLYAPDVPGWQFVHDTYFDQRRTKMAATGVRLLDPRWSVVVEQPAALLFDPIKRKIGWLITLSVVGVAVILIVARYISRKFTEPILRLQQGTKQIASGSFEYRVAVEANDEIGELADQFNQMAAALRTSHDDLQLRVAERTRELSALYSALTPLAVSESASQLLERVIERLVSATGADAGAIRLIDREQNLQISVAQVGFSLEHYSATRPANEGSADRMVFETREPIISDDIATDDRIRKKKQLEFGYHSCAFLPLIINDEVRGIIHLAAKTRGYFTEEQREYLTTIARIMGVVAGNSELLQSSLRYAEQLAHSNADLEQFAYVASHDLQEPLRMITGYTQLLAKRYEGKLDKDADEFIGYAIDGAKRMSDMIKDLLAYSRLGTQSKKFEPTDCEVVFQETVVTMQVAIQESGAKVTHGPLPTVSGDGIQLGRLFQNLIGNAIKYRNGQAPEVHVACERRDKGWLFSVIDNGIGIDPQHAERIFVLFQRLHTSERYQGTGIGLASCKKIVERHGGAIWVKSEPGKGSTFYFTLPALM